MRINKIYTTFLFSNIAFMILLTVALFLPTTSIGYLVVAGTLINIAGMIISGKFREQSSYQSLCYDILNQMEQFINRVNLLQYCSNTNKHLGFSIQDITVKTASRNIVTKALHPGGPWHFQFEVRIYSGENNTYKCESFEYTVDPYGMDLDAKVRAAEKAFVAFCEEYVNRPTQIETNR